METPESSYRTFRMSPGEENPWHASRFKDAAEEQVECGPKGCGKKPS